MKILTIGSCTKWHFNYVHFTILLHMQNTVVGNVNNLEFHRIRNLLRVFFNITMKAGLISLSTPAMYFLVSLNMTNGFQSIE